jgi:dTDP-4-dehydrorhamnose 3,5-epimerase
METIEHKIKGLIEFIPRVFGDERGFFFESFNKVNLENAGIKDNFVQDNQSFSKKGVVRGLHFQKNPFAQGKLVRVITGKALDVAVDLRKNSPTFGQYETFLLDSTKQNMVYIPAGFAHGFSALEDTIFFYKCTNFYNKASEAGIIWNDPTLNINWEVESPNVSDKDKELKTLEELIECSEVFE